MIIETVETDPDVLADMEMIFAVVDRKREKRLAREASMPPRRSEDPSGDFAKGISCVYVIGQPDQHVVKIRWSTNLRSRLTNLQCGSALPLTVLWATRGKQDLEDALHVWFSPQRLTGEWFDFPDGDAIEQVRAAVKMLRGEEIR